LGGRAGGQGPFGGGFDGRGAEVDGAGAADDAAGAADAGGSAEGAAGGSAAADAAGSADGAASSGGGAGSGAASTGGEGKMVGVGAGDGLGGSCMAGSAAGDPPRSAADRPESTKKAPAASDMTTAAVTTIASALLFGRTAPVSNGSGPEGAPLGIAPARLRSTPEVETLSTRKSRGSLEEIGTNGMTGCEGSRGAAPIVAPAISCSGRTGNAIV
jgi:hypothetical protein